MKIEVPSGVVVWVDVDEVLLDFRSMFHSFLLENHGINIPKGFIPKDWLYKDVLGELTFSEVFSSIPKNWALRLNAFNEAKDFLNELNRLECRVVLITHIPGECGPDRIENLHKLGLNYDEIYFTFGKNKSDYAKPLVSRYSSSTGGEVVNLFIDDNAENVFDFLKNVPNLGFATTLDYEYNSAALVKINEMFKKEKFDSSSKTHKEMYEKILKKVRDFSKKE